nr:sensor domain-containing diguanylate cyclase [Bacillus solitudinis]
MIGTLCATDSVTFDFKEKHKAFIKTMAQYVSTIIELDEEIAKKEQAQKRLNNHNQILTSIARGAPLEKVLETICYTVEEMGAGVRCSVLGFNKDTERLSLIAAPSFPNEFKQRLNGLAIGPKHGSCGTAAYRKELVAVSDISLDPLWDVGRERVLKEGLRACWSIPILSSANEVLGTFAMYYPEQRTPTVEEIERLEQFSSLASIALEKKRDEEFIHFLAYHDELTQLPNRRYLIKYLDTAFQETNSLFMMILDLDEFKEINDTHGHLAGDDVLIEITDRIKPCIESEGFVARLGGDEFAFVLQNMDEDKAKDIALQVINAVTKPVLYEGIGLAVTASIGIASFPRNASTITDLKKAADYAMYQAKKSGKNCFAFYEG